MTSFGKHTQKSVKEFAQHQFNHILTGERAYRPTGRESIADKVFFERQVAAYQLAVSFLLRNYKVLDIACGSGYGTEFLAQNGTEVIGADIDSETIERCRQEVTHPSCRFIVANGIEVPLPDHSVDLVVSFQTIEHILAHDQFVTELRRVLVPGGICLITTPNRRLRLAPGQRPWNRFHVREYDAAQLNEILQSAFDSVEIRGLFAEQHIMDFEHRRLKIARTVAKWDPLKLRHRVPPFLRSTLLGCYAGLRSCMPTSNHQKPAIKCQPSDFYLQSKTDEALDLFAVCR